MHSPLFWWWFAMNDHHRQSHAKCRSLIAPVARRVDRPAVQLDEMSHDREAEADAAVFARACAILLSKSFENVWQEIRGNAVACVADDDLDVGIDAFDPNLHDS